MSSEYAKAVFLAGDGAHAHALVDPEGTALDDALLQRSSPRCACTGNTGLHRRSGAWRSSPRAFESVASVSPKGSSRRERATANRSIVGSREIMKRRSSGCAGLTWGRGRIIVAEWHRDRSGACAGEPLNRARCRPTCRSNRRRRQRGTALLSAERAFDRARCAANPVSSAVASRHRLLERQGGHQRAQHRVVSKAACRRRPDTASDGACTHQHEFAAAAVRVGSASQPGNRRRRPASTTVSNCLVSSRQTVRVRSPQAVAECRQPALSMRCGASNSSWVLRARDASAGQRLLHAHRCGLGQETDER